MNRLTMISISFFLVFSASSVHADLNVFLADLNTRATTNLTDFHARLSVQFDVPVSYVNSLTKKVAYPGDAFMCLQLSLFTGKHIDEVVKIYTANQGKGWGVIAKELGIKPGSPEFHALKKGDFTLTEAPVVKAKKAKNKKYKNKGKGKGKGRKK